MRPPAAPGTLNIAGVHTEEGDGYLVFNHTATDYYFTKDGTAAGKPIWIDGDTQVEVDHGTTYLLSELDEYTGYTNIYGGTLVIADVGPYASVLGGGDVHVTGGTLAGSGTILGDVYVVAGDPEWDEAPGGILAPGDPAGVGAGAIGLMSFAGDLTLRSAATLLIQLGGGERGVTFDAIDVAGLLTYGGTLEFSLIDGFSPLVGDTFQIFDVTGDYDGAFDSIAFTDAGLLGDFDYDTGTLTITSLAAVPEPATYAAIFGGLALLTAGFFRRRRQIPSVQTPKKS